MEENEFVTKLEYGGLHISGDAHYGFRPLIQHRTALTIHQETTKKADTMPNERINEQPRVDILIHEATTASEQLPNHTSLETVINYYQIERMEKVVAVHLTDGERYDEVLQQAGPAVKDKVQIGYDLMRFNF